MKKLFFLIAFGIFSVAMANAQSCSGGANKACCANKVAKAAAADPSIEKRTAEDGSVSYVRREADATGNVQFVSVKFDETANAFVNVAPAAVSGTEKASMTKKSCSAGEKKACCAGGEKKACCAGGEKKACAKDVAPTQQPNNQ